MQLSYSISRKKIACYWSNCTIIPLFYFLSTFNSNSIHKYIFLLNSHLFCFVWALIKSMTYVSLFMSFGDKCETRNIWRYLSICHKLMYRTLMFEMLPSEFLSVHTAHRATIQIKRKRTKKLNGHCGKSTRLWTHGGQTENALNCHFGWQ